PSECSAELAAKLQRIERVENVLWWEEFRGAACEFGTEDRDTRENRFAGNQSPRIFKSRENQEIRRAVNAQHGLRRLRWLELYAGKTESTGEPLGRGLVGAISDEKQRETEALLLQRCRGTQKEIDALSADKLADI